MFKLIVRTAMFGILLVELSALPASAQISVPAGNDYWATPPGGGTNFTFPWGEVESLCGAAPSEAWNHNVSLQGVALSSTSDYDTVVRRLDSVTVTPERPGKTRVQVTGLSFRGSSPATPCGPIDWTVGASGPQRTTTMTIRQTSAQGGIFNASLAVDIEFRAHDAAGNYIGSLFYAIDLPDPSSGTGAGTPWSIDPANGRFRAGMDELNNCLAVLRQKLTQYATTSEHYYYISNLIAQGRCTRQ